MTNQWISVKDRVPHVERKAILVAYKNGAVGVHWLDGLIPLEKKDVTHWMPLPEPPPPPDPFEEWAEKNTWRANPECVQIPTEEGNICSIPRYSARRIWDAALASTKKT
jgi:hypothetical protein